MSQEWKLVPVEPTTEQRLAVCMHPDLASALYRSMIKAAPTPPNFIACHVDESCGQGGGEMEVNAFSLTAGAVEPSGDCGKSEACIDYGDHDEYWGARIAVYGNAAEDAEALRDAVLAAWDGRAHVTRLQAENAALQQRLNVADQLVDDLKKDKERLDALEANYWDVRHHSSSLGDTRDYTSCVEVVGSWMDKPHERVIGENYNENLRAAIDQAMTADAYPPAKPEYPELDAALSDEDWHMNPCKQGHRDVGACGGKAFCHTCDETITAETTQEAFEQWNATHPATPQ